MILPRPENAVPAAMLPFYERRGWWAQVKMNGTYTQVTVDDGVVVDTRNRHDEQHKAWRPTEESARVWGVVASRIPGRWVFVAELMHSKVPGIRDTHYVHDVVCARNLALVGTTYRERWAMLGDVFGHEVQAETDSHWIIDGCTWLAKRFTPGSDYAALFASLTAPEHEGLVLKNPAGVLQMRSNADWLAKCRRPAKNAGF